MKRMLIGLTALVATQASAALPVSGKWMTHDKDSIVEIAPCGASVCGKVLRVLKMMPNGQTPIDLNNPDPALRNRPVQGMMILTGFTKGDNQWNGRIYDPKSGKSYKSKLARNPDGSLKVQGCIGFLCRSFNWTAVK